MIQRIQSLYLFIALILMGLIAWLPLGEILSGSQVFSFSVKGVVNPDNNVTMYSGLPLIVLLGIIVLLQLFIIFGYKKRVRQMRIATFNSLLMIGFMAVCWFFVQNSIKAMGDGSFALKLPVVFPFVAAVLNYLAIRAIGRDEALVRSIDRIR